VSAPHLSDHELVMLCHRLGTSATIERIAREPHPRLGVRGFEIGLQLAEATLRDCQRRGLIVRVQDSRLALTWYEPTLVGRALCGLGEEPQRVDLTIEPAPPPTGRRARRHFRTSLPTADEHHGGTRRRD